MALESGTYIDSLVSTNPTATDTVAQADDHLRLIKATLLATFPSITGAITVDQATLNGFDARITALEAIDTIPSGTRMLFQQTTAPTGWTKITTEDDKALRVVSGTASTGGSVAFTSAFAAQSVAGTIANTVSGSVGGRTLTTSHLPNNWYHKPNTPGGEYSDNYANFNYQARHIDWPTYRIQGGGGSHDHSAGSLAVSSTFTGSNIDMSVQYVDVIICSKD
jgi:hypothetical protein